jgi:hypothetical protein
MSGWLNRIEYRPIHYQTFHPKSHRPTITPGLNGALFTDVHRSATWVPNPARNFLREHTVYIPRSRTADASERKERAELIRAIAIIAIVVSVIFLIVAATQIDPRGSYSIGGASAGCFITGGVLMLGGGAGLVAAFYHERPWEL